MYSFPQKQVNEASDDLVIEKGRPKNGFNDKIINIKDDAQGKEGCVEL